MTAAEADLVLRQTRFAVAVSRERLARARRTLGDHRAEVAARELRRQAQDRLARVRTNGPFAGTGDWGPGSDEPTGLTGA